ncbi:DUF4381 domain-containing protein [Shimia marina]|uniref:DUF4381 domain-containing protein n=1 Tax=Shimia marina TaxID=321267 RepID=A0A0P1FFP5_9RHOB|nr:DUF4381 domain-containing protein [Shimia marina]CUH54365.1 hypothetical protein SHM7688_03835 [Shimia marina]SFE01732.1 protein of unknown function [Shimia marina]
MNETQTQQAAGTQAQGDSDSLVGLMNQLAEVPDPAAVSMMPQTAGWAVLAAVLLLVAVWRGWVRWKRYQANAYRREALQALSGAGEDVVMISTVLKRTALTAYGREAVASLSGAAWLRFLAQTGQEAAFETGAGRVLATAAYVAGPVSGGAEVAQLARKWIKTHDPTHPLQDVLAEAADV